MRKKVIIGMLIIAFMLGGLYGTESFAAVGTNPGSFTVGLTGVDKATENSEISITVQLKDIANMNGAHGGISSLTGVVTYDTSVLEKVGEEGKNGYSVTWGPKLVIAKSNGVSANTEIAILKFKVKNGATLGNTTITLSDIKGDDGTNEVTASNVSKTINIAQNTTEPINPSNPDNSNNSGNSNNSNNSNNSSNNNITNSTGGKDNTTSGGKIPQTGVSTYITTLGIPVALTMVVISFKKLRELKGIC